MSNDWPPTIHPSNFDKPLTAGMDNVLASRLGEAMGAAGKMPAGDLIDSGLALLRMLNERGFDVVAKK